MTISYTSNVWPNLTGFANLINFEHKGSHNKRQGLTGMAMTKSKHNQQQKEPKHHRQRKNYVFCVSFRAESRTATVNNDNNNNNDDNNDHNNDITTTTASATTIVVLRLERRERATIVVAAGSAGIRLLPRGMVVVMDDEESLSNQGRARARPRGSITCRCQCRSSSRISTTRRSQRGVAQRSPSRKWRGQCSASGPYAGDGSSVLRTGDGGEGLVL